MPNFEAELIKTTTIRIRYKAKNEEDADSKMDDWIAELDLNKLPKGVTLDEHEPGDWELEDVSEIIED